MEGRAPLRPLHLHSAVRFFNYYILNAVGTPRSTRLFNT